MVTVFALVKGGVLRPLSAAAVGAAVFALVGDYIETTNLLKITHSLDDASRLLVSGFMEVIAARLEDSDVLRDVVSASLERELELLLA